MEDHFNHWAGYDWVFLNEEDFTDDFKKYTSQMTSAKCHYGKIEKETWLQPDWIDEEKATAAREQMVQKKVIYGFSVPYRNMCRYQSGVSSSRICLGSLLTDISELLQTSFARKLRLLLASRVSVVAQKRQQWLI